MKFIFDANRERAPSQERMAKLAHAMNPPTDIGSGLMSVANALQYRRQQNPFPDAPGSTMLGSLFGFARRGGGLY